YRTGDQEYFLVVNASNIEKDMEWLNKHNRFECNITDISDGIALLAVQGPKATDTLQKLTKTELGSIKYYHFVKDTFAGVEDVIISATGYTGSGGFEIYCTADRAMEVWDKIFAAGQEYGIKPAGLGCRDTLRMEMGFCLYGHDINDYTSPLEAGLGWVTKFNKDFIAKEILENQKEKGLKRKLVGLDFSDKIIPRQHFEIVDDNDRVIGEVTSGTMAPSLQRPIAMGYVEREFAKEGTKVKVKIRNKVSDARIVKFPFYKN
ncbi:MAG: glycine cleavage system aminomethyltransferase GcvT, partial [Bacteroidota bacterium]|nr:glycine cleavage system aminomethyltransferase GcvT [Bacteroidota bacterium]